MNRSSNLLNGALLGSSGRTSRIYINIQQWCEAHVASVITVGRKLSNTADITGLTSAAVLRAGRKLQSLVRASTNTSAKLFGLFAVPLIPVNPVLTMQVSAVVRNMHPITLTLGVQSLEMQTATNITCIHPVPLSINELAEISTQSTLSRYGLLKSNLGLVADFSVVLTEASRVRAPNARIVYFPTKTNTSIMLDY